MGRPLNAAPLGAALLIATIFGAAPAMADAVADFYRGKQIRVIVRTLPATDYDAYSRLIARFMGKYIPGNPAMIVVNMTGGGGIIAANYMAEVAPRDGTVIGIVSQGLAADQALGQSPQLKANLREFNWIANVVFSNQLLVTWHTSETKTLEQAKQRVSTIGTTGAGSASVQYPLFYNSLLGTRFKIITGYRSGAEIDLAMERGEVEGRGTNPYSSYMATHPTWIPQNKLNLAGAGRGREGARPAERAADPRSAGAGQGSSRCSRSWRAASTVGRPLATTPGVPADRVAALRRAFEAAVKDPDFIAAAAKEKLDVRPQSGDKIAEIIFGLLDTSADVRERMKAALASKDLHELAQPADKKK